MMVGAVLAGLAVLTGGTPGPDAQEPAYFVYVASESDDEVTVLRFEPARGLSIERVVSVGALPAEIEAPHGIFMDPDGEYWYLTLGHGFPFGSLWKYSVATDAPVASVELGMFPATIAVAPFGGVAMAVNSDFHGDMVPSTVSIVDLETMTEIDRIRTCTMPHGSRFSPDGLRHYSACMMDDQLVEIDVATLEVRRRLDLVSGEAARPMPGQGPDHPRQVCSPTWAAPAPDGAVVYVACNRGDEIVEVDVEGWRIARRFAAPNGPYNLEVTPDGAMLLATQKGSGAVGVWDRASGERVAFLPSTRKVTHGVAVSPDSRFAFISVEGIGGEPGAVDVVDLTSMRVVATIDVGKQAGGIAFWKMTG